METDSETVRLKVHLVAETIDGKRIAEITRKSVFHYFRTEESWMEGNEAFKRMLQCEVLAPARALVSVHLRRLEEVPFIQIERRMPHANITLPETERKNLDGLLAEITRQRECHH